MYREYDPPERVRARPIVTLLAVAFVVALAVVIGTRMSSDAIAVLVGVIAGVAASIPTALLLLAVTRQRPEEAAPEPREEMRHATPPVIVVAPGNVPQVLPQYAGVYPQQVPSVQGPRQFRVMGLDDEDMEPLEGEAEPAPWSR